MADCRIDNRDEIGSALGIEPSRLAVTCDAELLFMAWIKWGEASLQHVQGDFAIAVWEQRRRRLILARAPLSMKPLFYREGPSGVAVASMPGALLSLDGLPPALDLEELGAVIANAPSAQGKTVYRGVQRVEPGWIVSFNAGGRREHQFWRCDPRLPVAQGSRELAEEFQEIFGRAVKARLRRAHGMVASELSSGRDSSAVTAIAAEALDCTGGRLIALTHAPRAGYSEPTLDERLADESGVAAGTAMLHPNVDHRVVRSSGPFDFGQLDAASVANQYPIRQISNTAWYLDNLREARSAGASVLLGGVAGNLTISAGGPAMTPDLLRSSQAARWLREVGKSGGLRWPSLANSLLAFVLPRPAHKHVVRFANRARYGREMLPFLREPYRRKVEALLASQAAPNETGYSEYRRRALQRFDQGGMMTIALAGIDYRDPTADRRLAEFCVGLGPEHLIGGRHGRPLFDTIMNGRVDPRVLRPERRGLQGADWHERFVQADVGRALDKVEAGPEFKQLFDVEFVRELIARWPDEGWERWEVYRDYRDRLLTVLSVGSFIRAVRQGELQ